jgi:hypothetical protein
LFIQPPRIVCGFLPQRRRLFPQHFHFKLRLLSQHLRFGTPLLCLLPQPHRRGQPGFFVGCKCLDAAPLLFF